MKREIDGQMISCPMYHITLKPRTESIFKHGLLPARDSKGLGFDQPYPSDDSFVYLFNSIRMQKNVSRVLNETDGSWLADKEILEIDFPSSHTLEREYDQAVIPLKLSGEALDWFLGGRKQNSPEEYIRYYFQKTYGIKYTGNFTISDICQFIDSEISDESWDEKDGSYRTTKAISPELIRTVPLEKFST